MLMFAIFWVFTLRVSAPCINQPFYILKPEPIYVFNIRDPILRAFVGFESFYNQYVVNPISGARGILQFLPVMINEVNRILLECDFNYSLYSWEDAFDVQKSIDMWYIVQRYHNPDYNIQKACQIWFGIGVQYDGMTWVSYYKRIQKRLST